MIGRTLGGRYIVETRVGGGGMATVYRGVDSFLHRQVALKVLRAQFADDAEFVGRFRREARAAASLSHPNIVAVYDVGQEGTDCYYIVQEFVDGRTLKDRIEADGPLPVAEALGMIQQVLRALGHAHAVGVIHRDVKPQNVLLTRDGRVKVTDFGIARAETGATFVHTGAILGTAHYAAPEQVRGQPTDQRCDLYSTGVVLYEMLSGHPPFDGESPLAVALQHVELPVPDIGLARPDVESGVRAVLAHAMAKSPDERYRGTEEMAADIEAVLEGGAPTYAPGLDPASTPLGAAAAVPSAMPEPPAEGSGAGRRPGRADGADWARLAAIAAGVVVGLAVLAGLGAFLVSRLLNVREVAVPAVVGDSLDAAEQAITGARLGVQVNQENDAQTPAGEIARSSPPPGTPVRQGSTVQIWQSLGPPNVTMPDVAGLTLAAAETELGGMGLQPAPAAGKHYSASVPQGYVISSTPAAGATLQQGAAVSLQVSAGPAGVGTMPDYVGATLQVVQADLANRQLTAGPISREPTGWPAGIVAATAPVAGAAAPAGTTVDLTVSSGCVAQFERTFQAGTAASGTGASGTAASASGVSASAASGTGASGTGASGTGAGAPAAAGMREQVLIQDVGQASPRLIFDRTVPPGQTFAVQLCWSSPQGAVWTWEENGVVVGSGTVTSAAAPAGTQTSGTTPAGGASSSVSGAPASSSSGSGGTLPSSPQPGQSGIPSESSTPPGPG